MNADLILVRGLPGSGKSTYASKLPGYVHLETDGFFMRNGVYNFDGSKIRQAHQWCQDQVKKTLAQGHKVVVSNTFTQLWEMDAYLKMAREMGKTVEVVTITTQFKNIHDVPQASLDRMKARWEKYPGEVYV